MLVFAFTYVKDGVSPTILPSYILQSYHNVKDLPSKFSTLFSDVTSVEPRNGSLAGGTILTIKGKAFSFTKKNIEVTVGGEYL